MLAALAPVAGDLPSVGLDIILDGPRSAPGSFLEAAGPKVENAYGVFPTGIDPVLGSRPPFRLPTDVLRATLF